MITTQSVAGRTLRDFLHCLECDGTFDYYHFDSLADSGHNGHALRALNPPEFRAAACHCQELGCADE